MTMTRVRSPEGLAARVRATLRGAAVTGALATACGGPTGTAVGPAAVAPPSIVAKPDASASGPRWRVHPPSVGEVRDGAPLDAGRWLLVDERGRRWLARPLPATEGAPEASGYLADASLQRTPAPLVAAATAPAGAGYLLLDSQGNLYRTPSPLGALTSAPRPPEQLIALERVGDVLLGLDPLGQLLRWQSAGGWARVELGERLFDLAAAADGSLLGLAMPETLVESRDEGRSWRRAERAPLRGTRELAAARGGGVLVRGITGDALWAGHGQGLAEAGRSERLAVPGEAEGPVLAAAAGPNAAALVEGSAVLSGSSYYAAIEAAARPELAAAVGIATRWIWARGTITGPLELGALPIGERCDSIHLAAAGAHVLLGCVHFDEGGDRALLELQVSGDAGRSWRERQTLTTPETAAVALALAGQGTALVVGACRESAEECEPRAPLRIGPTTGAPPVPTRAVELLGPAREPVFSADESRAYFVGLRAKDERPALFVSQDGARSFTAVPIELGRPMARASGDGASSAAALLELLAEGASLAIHPRPGADGRIGLVLDADVPLYALGDELGRVRQLARLPPDTVAVSGAGGAILALVAPGPTDEGESIAELWQSTDGGRSFRPLRGAPALGLEELQSTGDELRQAVQCGVGGCVLGALASRLGWEEQEAEGASAMPTRSPAGGSEPAVLGPIECTVDPANRWQTIRSVHSDSGSVLPSASALMRGALGWSVLQVDDETGAATVLGAPADGPSSDLVVHRLLGGLRDRQRYAIDVAHQLEGYAVARVPLPEKGALDGAPMRELTAAWLDAYAGTREEVTLPIPDRFGPRSVTPGTRPALYGTLLSVAGKGLLVRLDRNVQELRLVGEGPGAGATLGYPTWPAIVPGLRLEEDALVIDGQPMALGWLLEERSRVAAIGLAPLGAAAADPTFIALGPRARDGREIAASLGYRGSQAGITLHVALRDRPMAWATFCPLDAARRVGRAVALPTQASLGEQTRACSAAERRASPRLLAPRLAGTRHPVVVRAEGSSLLLLTDAAVLHGTPEDPCVAAWAAPGIGSSASGVLGVIGGEPARSWLLRPTPGVRAALDAVAMSCRSAPDLPLPPEIWTADGTHVRRGP